MFGSLSKGIKALTKKFEFHRGEITQQQFDDTKGELRRALLEADVSLKAIGAIIEGMSSDFISKKIIKGVDAHDMIVKLMHDAISKVLGASATTEVSDVPNQKRKDTAGFELRSPKDSKITKIMLVGLQGAGKTTTCAKLAKHIESKDKTKATKVLLTSLDYYRPAARAQLKSLCKTNNFHYSDPDSTQINSQKAPLETAIFALEQAKKENLSVIIFDTAGRLTIDNTMMDELVELEAKIQPDHIILVVDAMIGRTALTIASQFIEKLNISGLIFTKVDSDARAGSILSIKTTHNLPVHFLATGEGIDDLDEFIPERMADRILGMGDIVTLVEKAGEAVENDNSDALKKKAAEGKLDLMDILDQLKFLKKLGGLPFINKFLPRDMLESSNVSEEKLRLYEGVILSMTMKERLNTSLVMNSISRKSRISKGSGAKISLIEDLLNMHSKISVVAKSFAMFDKSSASVFDKFKMGDILSDFTKK